MKTTKWARLTAWLAEQHGEVVTLDWRGFDTIVGGVPASAIKYKEWWHGDRPNTRAWRDAGYEVASVEPGRTVTFHRTGQAPPAPSILPKATPLSQAALPYEDPGQAMIILYCSATKAHGGCLAPEMPQTLWTAELRQARERVLAKAYLDDSRVLPAWRRYTGGFFKGCAAALAEAVRQEANIVILSGGYGVVTADEPIGYYDRRFHLSDWPPGCLQRALLRRVADTQPRSVVAFASATSDYAKLVSKTPWADIGIPVHLVTRKPISDGAMAKVPKVLAQAFTAYWQRNPGIAPADLNLKQLA